MSELIKENTTESMIAMVRLRTTTLFNLALMTVLFLSTLQNTAAFLPSQDTLGPSIYGWGTEGEPELGQGFDVWANVSDEDSGVRNVTVEVTGPNMTLSDLMPFNGTLYSGSVPAFPNSGEFRVRVRAYDIANNTQTSYRITIVYEAEAGPAFDPTVTMPAVVLSSVGLMIGVTVLALIYDRRRGPLETSDQPGLGT